MGCAASVLLGAGVYVLGYEPGHDGQLPHKKMLEAAAGRVVGCHCGARQRGGAGHESWPGTFIGRHELITPNPAGSCVNHITNVIKTLASASA